MQAKQTWEGLSVEAHVISHTLFGILKSLTPGIAALCDTPSRLSLV